MITMSSIDVNLIVESMIKLEGFQIEEAVLTSKSRENLPSSAFCGPNRTYPAHDKKHVRNALSRLKQFGSKLKPATKTSILSCLKRRGKRMGIEVEEVMEDPFIEWYRRMYLNKEDE